MMPLAELAKFHGSDCVIVPCAMPDDTFAVETYTCEGNYKQSFAAEQAAAEFFRLECEQCD